MPSRPADDPEALIPRAVAGDRAALDALFAKYWPKLRAYLDREAGKLIKAKESASDLMQSVSREVLEQVGKFQDFGRGEDAFKNWLFAKALRKLQDRHRHYRRAKRNAAREVALEQRHGSMSGEDMAALVLRVTGGQSREAMTREEMTFVRHAMQQLPERQQQVIEWHHFEGLSYAEIAERLQTTAGAARSLLTRGLVGLRRTLDRLQGP